MQIQHLGKLPLHYLFTNYLQSTFKAYGVISNHVKWTKIAKYFSKVQVLELISLAYFYLLKLCICLEAFSLQ